MIHAGELGTIEYRLPTVPEALELWGRIGIDPNKLDDTSSPANNVFILISKIIANMGHLVIKIDVMIDDAKVTTYDDLCKDMRATKDLCAIAGRVLEAMNGGSDAKKKQSETL